MAHFYVLKNEKTGAILLLNTELPYVLEVVLGCVLENDSWHLCPHATTHRAARQACPPKSRVLHVLFSQHHQVLVF